jgi:hypothetical protein
VIEHLRAEEITDFLAEAHRSYDRWRPCTGHSESANHPSARVGAPEHTLEFTVDEISELLELAGFTELRIRGVLLRHDPQRHALLPLEAEGDDDWSWTRLPSAAEPRPDPSFTWWAEAMQADREPDIEVLQPRVRESFDAFRAIAANRFRNEMET